jgi:signal transduction histidine kinase
MSSALEAAGIRLKAEWTEGVTVNANPESLKRIAGELLENVRKFAVSDALMRNEKHEGRIILTVSNDCTLPDGSCDNVFDRFIRLANAEGKPGAGLGLSFVKDAVRQIGGRVSAKVENGRFILQLFL